MENLCEKNVNKAKENLKLDPTFINNTISDNESKGIGIGLSTANKLAQALGGGLSFRICTV